MPQVEVMERKDLSSMFRPMRFDSNLPAVVGSNQDSLRISDVSEALHNRNLVAIRDELAAIRAEAERLRREKEWAQQERLREQSFYAEPGFSYD